MTKLEQLIKNQIDFQKLVGLPIETNLESERDWLAEIYIFKMIEEAVELRKEFPSTMNKWSKANKPADFQRIKEEFCDVIFFLMNTAILFRLTENEILEELEKIQKNNFNKIKNKMMNSLNDDILKIQNRTNGIGQGKLNPKYIFIGQNPANGITKGYKFWSDENDGSSKILLPILDRLGIKQDCYFTNIVKCSTEGNSEPDEKLTEFYKEFLNKELEILMKNNEVCQILALGRWASDHLDYKHKMINHPSYIMRGGMDIDQYAEQIRTTVTSVT